MDTLLSALASLWMHLSPVVPRYVLTSEHLARAGMLGLFVFFAGLIHALSGGAARGHRGRALLLAGGALLGALILGRGAGPDFSAAQPGVLWAGHGFRFLGGLAAANGLLLLFGTGVAHAEAGRGDLSAPPVLWACLAYGLLFLDFSVLPQGQEANLFRFLGMGVPLFAAWIAFAGVHGHLRRVFGPRGGGGRGVTLMSAGFFTLLLLSFLVEPRGGSPHGGGMFWLGLGLGMAHALLSAPTVAAQTRERAWNPYTS